MIGGYLHQGSGLGNQLFRYITVRTIAKQLETGYEMIYNPDGSGKEEGFKGKFFIEQPVVFDNEPQGFELWQEKKVVENGVDVRGYDPEINFVGENTIIEGEFQDERYWNLKDVDHWLRVEPIAVADDVCVIGFRGGEYAMFNDLFLPAEYWRKGIDIVKSHNPHMQFHVVTDDVELAKVVFPGVEVTHDIAMDWKKMRYARYAIIANSSFYILPRLLAHQDKYNALTIAPRYWARHNTKTWALPQNYYQKFFYV